MCRLLAPIWNRDNISNIQILFKETSGPDAQGRAAYFDRVGIVRDVVQSHLLQARSSPLLVLSLPRRLAVWRAQLTSSATDYSQYPRSLCLPPHRNAAVGSHCDGPPRFFEPGGHPGREAEGAPPVPPRRSGGRCSRPVRRGRAGRAARRAAGVPGDARGGSEQQNRNLRHGGAKN